VVAKTLGRYVFRWFNPFQLRTTTATVGEVVSDIIVD
jgi:hypothetical protein